MFCTFSSCSVLGIYLSYNIYKFQENQRTKKPSLSLHFHSQLTSFRMFPIPTTVLETNLTFSPPAPLARSNSVFSDLAIVWSFGGTGRLSRSADRFDCSTRSRQRHSCFVEASGEDLYDFDRGKKLVLRRFDFARSQIGRLSLSPSDMADTSKLCSEYQLD